MVKIRKQLKTEFPNWKRLTRKEKKAVSKMVLDEVVKDYDFNQEVKASSDELIYIEGQSLNAGIMDLEEMGRFVEGHKNSVLFKLNIKKHPLILAKNSLGGTISIKRPSSM